MHKLNRNTSLIYNIDTRIQFHAFRLSSNHVLQNITITMLPFSILYYWQIFVKLHSDLTVLTEFKLDRVEVDLVFTCHKKKRRRRRKEQPSHSFCQNDGPTSLTFGGCPVGVWRVSGGYLWDV